MQNWKLTLSYDGTEYRGWQVQPRLITVQGELQTALRRILRLPIDATPLPQGSGRTDSGVHAMGQVVSVVLEAPIPAANLMLALNRTLPSSIRVLAVTPAPEGFHARHSATAKTYEYRIYRGALCSPFLTRYVYPCRWTLDLSLLSQAASQVVGEHDFVSLAASDDDLSTRFVDCQSHSPSPGSTVRTIFSSAWSEEAGELLIYRVRGNGFLHHMVRNLVGTMLEIGRGQFSPTAMPEILNAKSRSAAGPTAPARGLFLHSVEYDSDLESHGFDLA